MRIKKYKASVKGNVRNLVKTKIISKILASSYHGGMGKEIAESKPGETIAGPARVRGEARNARPAGNHHQYRKEPASEKLLSARNRPTHRRW